MDRKELHEIFESATHMAHKSWVDSGYSDVCNVAFKILKYLSDATKP